MDYIVFNGWFSLCMFYIFYDNCAFANTRGGVIIVGVSDRRKKVVRVGKRRLRI